MKFNKFILPFAALALLSTGCVEQIMEWEDPDSSITEADIPLTTAEALANYKAIKEYAAEYTPEMKIGLGLGADFYLDDVAYKALADENFQMFTAGNAMKHSSVVKANGDLNFATVDAFLAAVPADIEIYGHNFLWHTQQKQAYLKSLIAPEMHVVVVGDEICENVVTNGGFEDGTNGWTGLWGKYAYAVEAPGRDGTGNAIHFTINPDCANMWDAQLFWTLDSFLEDGVTYAYEFYAKSDSGLKAQFIGQNASYGGIYGAEYIPGTDWAYFSGEFTYDATQEVDIERVGFQFGGEPGSQIWFDDFKFGKKVEKNNDPMINIVTNSGFEDGAEGWTGLWGQYTYEVDPAGQKGQCMAFTLTAGCANQWDAQLFWPVELEVGKTYAYSFYAKSDSGLNVQFIGQNESYEGIYKNAWDLPADWMLCEGEFTYGESDPAAICRIGVQFGKAASEGAKFWIDEFKFGEKNEAAAAPADPMLNIVTNGDFEAGEEGWTGLWGKYTYETDAAGHNGQCLAFTLTADCANQWDAQLFWPVDLEVGKTYAFSFWAKSDSGLSVQFIGQNESYGGIYGADNWELPGEWFLCEGEYTYLETDPEAICRIGVQFGKAASEGAKFWIDDFKFGEKIVQPAAAYVPEIKPMAEVTYIYKTPEEKKAILLQAMESWIKQMAEHVGDRVVAWDVINEPIADGSNAWRGIDNVFMDGDYAPVEDKGLNLNWGSDHWYWGYYIGKEYAVKAFEFARKYCAPGVKLFVNDYNLEVSPGKLQAIIDFVKYIEDNGQTVDGIGTQMHVSTSIRKEQVDAMFKTMAATGKLVRVTELDVAVGTSSPTPEQLLAQAETYRMIVESYKENVPAEQQSGITIWTLTDSAAEHEFWLNGDAPNLFDANYARKEAYKYFCDGLAGRDIADDFDGLDWKNAVEEEETPAE